MQNVLANIYVYTCIGKYIYMHLCINVHMFVHVIMYVCKVCVLA